MKNKKIVFLAIIIVVGIIGSLVGLKITKVESITINGSYSEGACDEIYTFTSDGKAELGYNLAGYDGTYTSIGDNKIQINFTEYTMWDIDTGEKTVEEINKIVNLNYINETTLEVINEDGTTYQISKFEE